MAHKTLYRSIALLSLILLAVIAGCVHKLATPTGLPSDGVNRNPPGVMMR